MQELGKAGGGWGGARHGRSLGRRILVSRILVSSSVLSLRTPSLLRVAGRVGTEESGPPLTLSLAISLPWVPSKVTHVHICNFLGSPLTGLVWKQGPRAWCFLPSKRKQQLVMTDKFEM